MPLPFFGERTRPDSGNGDPNVSSARIGGLAIDDDISVSVHPDTQQGDYKLSNCSGRKRAVLIGINYFDSDADRLYGCIKDVHNIKDFIISYYGFKKQDMKVLTDDQEDPTRIPTRANIISALQWLVADAEENDSFFLHFSGHGFSVEDDTGDETDGFDETICPVDANKYEGTTGQIRDDELHEILVVPLPAGCRLTAIFDSCHSGTVLDLPYMYSTNGAVKNASVLQAVGTGLRTAAVAAYEKRNIGHTGAELMEIGKKFILTRFKEITNKWSFWSPADIVMFSGCKDEEEAADGQELGEATGALSHAFTTTLRNNPNQSYRELLKSIRDILSEKYKQKPQMSSSHPIDVNTTFVC